jgi:hypothetical protein
MSAGSAPTVTLSVDKKVYKTNTAVTPTITIADPDTEADTYTTVDDEGRDVSVTWSRVDRENVAWSWKSGAQITVNGSGSKVTVPAPATTDTLVATVVDGQGHEVTASVPVVVGAPMMIGVANVLKLSDYPGAKSTVVFNKPGVGIDIAKWNAVPVDVFPVLCEKDSPTAAMWDPVLDTLARPIWGVFHQEPEGDLPSADYKAGCLALENILAAHPNGHLVDRVSKLMLYAELHGKGPWDAWLTGTEDVLAVDCYLEAAATSYTNPADFFKPVIDEAALLGIPFAVPEFGAVALASDTDGSGLAKWYTDCINYLKSQGCLMVNFWVAQGTSRDFTPKPAVKAAIQKIVAAQ